MTEEIDAFSKLKFESQFQALSTGGAISYVEVPNMQDNIPAVLQVMRFIYDNIMYAELNTKSDYCQVCGYDGEIQIVMTEDGKLEWECPHCGNRDQDKLNVARRTCGYIGTQFWNQGRTSGDQGESAASVITVKRPAELLLSGIVNVWQQEKICTTEKLKNAISPTERESESPSSFPAVPTTAPDVFNQDTWDFSYGKEYTDETEQEIIEALSPDYINGLSLLGGEPFEPQNQQVLVQLLRKVREQYPQKTIWCYSGYLFDRELLSESRARCEYTDEMLSMIDILVDGRFVEKLKDIRLVFRGSSNQRIIDVKKSLNNGEVILWEPKVRRGV